MASTVYIIMASWTTLTSRINMYLCQFFVYNIPRLGSYAGRSYLAQNPYLVQALLSALTKEPKTSLTSENILGTLQKLSLRYLGRIIWYYSNLGQNNHYKNIAAIALPNISCTSVPVVFVFCLISLIICYHP